MFGAQTNNFLLLAQKGDPYARSILLASNKNFVKKTASQICNRVLHWHVDEELDVALNAFDDAIDSFSKSKEDNFFYYAEKIIYLRLYQHLEREDTPGEHASQLNLKNQPSLTGKPDAWDRQKWIYLLCENHKEVLEAYGVSHEDLLGREQKDCGLVVQLKVKIHAAREALRKHWESFKEEIG